MMLCCVFVGKFGLSFGLESISNFQKRLVTEIDIYSFVLYQLKLIMLSIRHWSRTTTVSNFHRVFYIVYLLNIYSHNVCIDVNICVKSEIM